MDHSNGPAIFFHPVIHQAIIWVAEASSISVPLGAILSLMAVLLSPTRTRLAVLSLLFYLGLFFSCMLSNFVFDIFDGPIR
jgi:hypothetical protein